MVFYRADVIKLGPSDDSSFHQEGAGGGAWVGVEFWPIRFVGFVLRAGGLGFYQWDDVFSSTGRGGYWVAAGPIWTFK
jgi:hypothetical protein